MSRSPASSVLAPHHPQRRSFLFGVDIFPPTGDDTREARPLAAYDSKEDENSTKARLSRFSTSTSTVDSVRGSIQESQYSYNMTPHDSTSKSSSVFSDSISHASLDGGRLSKERISISPIIREEAEAIPIPKISSGLDPQISPTGMTVLCADGTTVPSVGSFVETVARSNEINRFELDDPSCFHAVSIPPVSLVNYLQRLQVMCKITNESFIIGLVYVDRIITRHSSVHLNMLTVHRLALATTVVAAKFFEDIFYTNSCYARAGGVSLQELNGLEECILRLLEFNVFVTPDEYEDYRQLSVRMAAKGKKSRE